MKTPGARPSLGGRVAAFALVVIAPPLGAAASAHAADAAPAAAAGPLPPLPAPPSEASATPAAPAPAPAAPETSDRPPPVGPTPAAAEPAAEEEPRVNDSVERWIVISAGLGLSAGSDAGGRASGFYGAAQYVFLVSTWVSLRPYAGLLLTFPDHGSCTNGVTPCDVSAKIGFAGGKFRLTVPIPYVAPFIELGAGMSVGSISTQDAARNETFGGITYHVPAGLGLSIGAKQKVDLALQYLFHPDQHQFGGAFALSFGWRLR